MIICSRIIAIIKLKYNRFINNGVRLLRLVNWVFVYKSLSLIKWIAIYNHFDTDICNSETSDMRFFIFYEQKEEMAEKSFCYQ